MNKKFIIFLLSGMALLASCQKDIDTFVPDANQLNGPDTSWYSSISPTMPVNDLKNKLNIETYQDSALIGSNPVTFVTPNGLQCTFPVNGLTTSTGQNLTGGKVKVEMMFVRSKGDMIRLGRPTTSNGRLLVNSSDLFVRAKNDTAELQMASNSKFTLRYAENPLSTQMKFFLGDESNSQQFNWLPDANITTTIIGYNTAQSQYEIQTKNFRWSGLDYFYDTSNIQRVTLKAQLANYFTNANTMVYAVFRDFRSVVGMYGNASSKKFVSSTKLPVGKLVTVIVISKQGNDYFMGFENVTTAVQSGTNGEQNVSVTPVKKSLSEIISYLNTL